MQLLCPVCDAAGLELTTNSHEIAYFGEIMETMTKCQKCGYRHVDVMVLGEKEPSRYTFKAEGTEDLNVRVVRSGKSTVEIKELGVKITPGPANEGYISNVEGVLTRIEDIVFMQKDSERKRALLEKIKKAKEGKFAFNLKITDPSGNSAILSDRAKKEGI
ncbi:ZPR1 zinc finger domain-containing protein [archaeon]|nr:ZPR1 zinc finger domain-containing protein [archaeon]